MENHSKVFRQSIEDAKFLKKNLHKLVRDLLSESYHGLVGTWSSSQLKDILDDEELFIKKYVKREIPREGSEAFDTGTYFHTSVLEPHKVGSEIAVFDGKTRYGKKWDEFKKLHKGKALITASQKEQGDQMAKAVMKSPTCQQYLEGDPEVSLFVELVVWRGEIYAPKFEKKLTPQGWIDQGLPVGTNKGYQMIVKVRADTLGDTFISDLKSTSGNARREHEVRSSISKYKYDLSAALYLDMFSLVRPSVRDFIWIFASKGTPCAQSWRATKNNILVGRAKYSKAMVKLADCAQANWELVDCLREAEPLPHEMEWTRQKDTDLL